MSFMFYADTAFNQNLGSWDVSNVTNMSHMFAGMYSIFSEPIPSKFNMDISSWDVSKVTDMSNMFNICKFNMPVGTWNVGNVRNMSSMFAGQYKDGETPDFFSLFDQDIGSWDVSKVEDMSSMFYTSYFNSDIGDWDVGNVTNMSWMFCLAGLFNQDIGDWDVSNVTNMDIMFVWACDFNQDLSGWCVEKIDSIPYSFNDYCTFNKAFYPFWGTCPAAVHINDTDNAGSLSTYPNPASTFLTIETGISGLYDIEISSLNGRLLYQWEYEEPVIQLDLSSFQSGIYFITISSEDFVTTRKIVKL
jgi:surface protein